MKYKKKQMNVGSVNKVFSQNLIILCSFLFISVPIFAERGDVEQTEPLITPTLNFPGYFDTNVVPKYMVSIDLPLASLNFGATENFTVGLNLPLIFYMADTWMPAFVIDARYRFFSNKKLSSTLSGLGGYFSYDNSSNDIKLYFVNGTYNNAITLTKHQFLTTQVNAVSIHYQNHKNTPKFEKTNINLIALALGHNMIFTPNWSVQNIFAIPILMNVYEENTSSSGNVSFKHFQNFPLFYRIFAAWRVSPKNLITFGGFLVTQSEMGFVILPWIDWTFNL